MNRWPKIPLGEVATCLDSQRIPLKDDDRQKRLGSVPYYGANGQVGWINEAIFDEPLLLVAEDGGHFDEPKRGVAYTIRGPAWVNNHAHVLRMNESKVLLDFLGYHFRHFDFRPYITGTTRAKLTQRDLMRVSVPVPPLAEQGRIVKLLDEADELPKLRTQADRRTARLIPALFHEMFGDTILNPHKWPKSTLGLACQKLTDGTHFSPPPTDAGVPYITAKHLREHGLDFDRDPTYISPENHREIYARCDPKPGDVLYIKDGVTTGLAAVNRYDYEFSMLSSLALMRPDPAKCDSEFLCAWLNNNAVKASMLGQMAGAAIRRLTLVKLKRAPILLPPLLLQKEFAKRVTEIRKLEAKQAASRERLDALFQSMLHRAFCGEL
jgi:type I restriction enzyme S subunit